MRRLGEAFVIHWNGGDEKGKKKEADGEDNNDGYDNGCVMYCSSLSLSLSLSLFIFLFNFGDYSCILSFVSCNPLSYLK